MRKLEKVPVWILLILGSAVFLLPLLMTLSMSVKPEAELLASSSWDPPKNVTWDNYKEVLSNPNVSFLGFFKNSFVIAVTTMLGTLLSCSMVAYAFARLKFPGQQRMFLIVLATMMLPGVVTMIPTYVLYKYFGWINTFLPLTVPSFFAVGAFNIFLLRQFFATIPRDLDEAALMDGASHWTIYSRIILPLSGPALATIAIFTFIGSWRDFMGPLLYLNDLDRQTLELGLSTYASFANAKWHLLLAGSVLVMIPIVIVFLIGQRYFVKGVSMTGLK